MQVGRSASHILTFVFYVQKPKEVGWARLTVFNSLELFCARSGWMDD
jgi:hypothetical protein